jgi:hypothetical protein
MPASTAAIRLVLVGLSLAAGASAVWLARREDDPPLSRPQPVKAKPVRSAAATLQPAHPAPVLHRLRQEAD